MSRAKGFVLIILIIPHLSGCSTYRYVSLPGTDYQAIPSGESEFGIQQVGKAEVGSQARITMISGDVFSGKIADIAKDKIVVDLGEETMQVIAVDQIRAIELKKASVSVAAVLLGAAFLVGVGAAMAPVFDYGN